MDVKGWSSKNAWILNKYLHKYKYKYNINNPSVESEIHKHNEWRQEVDIHATPTILINGYELPENYKIEDLVYFTKLKI